MMTLSMFMVGVAIVLAPYVWTKIYGALCRRGKKVRFEETQKNKQFNKLLKKKGKTK